MDGINFLSFFLFFSSSVIQQGCNSFEDLEILLDSDNEMAEDNGWLHDSREIDETTTLVSLAARSYNPDILRRLVGVDHDPGSADRWCLGL
jgi:hypothetical protein